MNDKTKSGNEGQVNAVKDLKYWKNRYGQIDWRLDVAKREVSQMEKDQQECLDKIKELEESNG